MEHDLSEAGSVTVCGQGKHLIWWAFKLEVFSVTGLFLKMKAEPPSETSFFTEKLDDGQSSNKRRLYQGIVVLFIHLLTNALVNCLYGDRKLPELLSRREL
jgi:hypothetical protein